MKKMTYNDVLVAATLLAALPLDVKVKEKGEEEYTRSLETRLTGRVLSLLANLNFHVKAYRELEEQARKAAVPEDFQNRFAEYQRKLETEGEKAQRDTQIEKEFEDYNSKYYSAIQELRNQEVELTPNLFTMEEFEKIAKHSQGAEIKLDGKSVSRLLWLVDLSEILVKK